MITRIKALVNRVRLKAVVFWHRMHFSLRMERISRLFKNRRFLMASYLLAIVLLAGAWWWDSPYRRWGAGGPETPLPVAPSNQLEQPAAELPSVPPPVEAPVVVSPPVIIVTEPPPQVPPAQNEPLQPVVLQVTNIEQLSRPIAGPIIAPFGFQWSATFRAFQFHHGVGIEATSGTPVLAAHGGRVASIVQNDPEWGSMITIEHGSGWQTVYASLTHIAVRTGQTVTVGQQLGQLGLNPPAKGAENLQLYFALFKDGESVDPTHMFR